MPDAYDLIVIGSGPGGYVGAIRAAQLGLRVALVEREKVGGTCLHIGCIPTKAMLHTAELLEHLKDPRELGLTVDSVAVDLLAVQRRKARVVDQLHKGVQSLMRKNKIDVFIGEGRFLSAAKIGVALADGSETELAAITDYAAQLGLLFQITDDLLDVTATAEALGKTPGKDMRSKKATYPALYGIEATQAHLLRTHQTACDSLDRIPKPTNLLRDIADFILERQA